MKWMSLLGERKAEIELECIEKCEIPYLLFLLAKFKS